MLKSNFLKDVNLIVDNNKVQISYVEKLFYRFLTNRTFLCSVLFYQCFLLVTYPILSGSLGEGKYSILIVFSIFLFSAYREFSGLYERQFQNSPKCINTEDIISATINNSYLVLTYKTIKSSVPAVAYFDIIDSIRLTEDLCKAIGLNPDQCQLSGSRKKYGIILLANVLCSIVALVLLYWFNQMYDIVILISLLFVSLLVVMSCARTLKQKS